MLNNYSFHLWVSTVVSVVFSTCDYNVLFLSQKNELCQKTQLKLDLRLDVTLDFAEDQKSNQRWF